MDGGNLPALIERVYPTWECFRKDTSDEILIVASPERAPSYPHIFISQHTSNNMIIFITKMLILLLFTLSYLLSTVSASCVDVSRYYQIYDDILSLATFIDNDIDRSHFYGGIVRLVAHDFMDYDHSSSDPLGMDGCIDWIHEANTGLSSLCNEHTDLYKLHKTKYPDISRPDFWIIAANAVIYHTSIDNSLDLINTFYWGRKERNECPEK